MSRILSAATVKQLVDAASAAPSMHNTQPWRFHVHGDTIEVHADPGRMLRTADPTARAVHLACGAAVFNLRLAAAVSGHHPVVRLLPDPSQPLLMATVHPAGRHTPSLSELELHTAIWNRHTNRRPFRTEPIPLSARAELTEAARIEGASLSMLDRHEVWQVLTLIAEAERRLGANPAYWAELARWTTDDPRRTDGIPVSAFGPRATAAGLPLRDFGVGRSVPDREQAAFEDHPHLTVLYTCGDEPADWLRAGQALEGVWLTATARGLAVSPLTQPLDLPDLRRLLRDRHAEAQYPQMILRLGRAPAVAGTPRRPSDDVLDA